MNPLTLLIRSQLMRLWRYKSLLVVALVGPLVLLLLAGLAFDTTSSYGLHVGAYVPAASELSESVLSTLRDNQVLLQSYPSAAQCTDAVRTGERNACLLFSSPFGIEEAISTITIVIDGSNLALAGILSDGLYNNIENTSVALSTTLVAQLVDAIDTVRQRTVDGKTTLVRIATASNGALQELKNGQGSVGDLDTGFDITGISLDTITTQSSVVQNVASATATVVYNAFDTVQTIISNATATVNASNASAADKLILKQQLQNISIAFNSTLDDMRSLNTTANVSATAVSASLTNIAAQLVGLKAKVDTVVAAKTGISNSLSSMEAQINQALVDITILQGSLDAIGAAVNGIKVTDPSRVTRPIQAIVQPLPVASRLAALYPALLVLVIAFGGLLIAPRLVHMEKHSGAQLRMALMPISRETRAIATIVTGTILVAGQALVLVIVSSVMYAAAAPISTFIVLVLTGLLFVVLGNAVSYLFETEEASMLSTLTLGTAFLLLSGIIIPIEYMPDALRVIAQYNPLLLATGIIRQTVVFGLSALQAQGVFSLVVGILVAAGLGYGALMFSRTHSVEALIEPKK